MSDFEGEKTSCRETCVLALGWAIQHLTAEMMKDIERPGGSDFVADATAPEWASERNLHDAIFNLQTPLDPRIPADASLMLAYKLGFRDARHAAAELVSAASQES